MQIFTFTLEQMGVGTGSSLRSVCWKQLPGPRMGSGHAPVPDERMRNGAQAQC